MNCETLLSISAIILLIIVSVMLGCQYTDKKHKHKKKMKMKWTCGVEGGCEKTMHGTYDSKKECESHCGYRFVQEELKDKLENELVIMKQENEDLKDEIKHMLV